MKNKNRNDVPLGCNERCMKSSLSKSYSRHHTSLSMDIKSQKRFNGSESISLNLLNTMLISVLVMTILMCPSVLCQNEEAALNNSPDNSDTAELLSPDNPCKANPCGNGVCLQEPEE